MSNTRIDLLTLKRGSKIDDIKKLVGIPRRAVPKNALADCYEFPLYQKLPMLSCPTNQILYSRQKLGHKLYKMHKTEFMLYDPYCHEVSYQYEIFHDPHLKPFFEEKRNNKRVKEIGSVTESNEALCSLRKFNEYRKFQNRLYIDAVNKKIKRINELDEDHVRLQHAEEIANLDVKKTHKLTFEEQHRTALLQKESDRKKLKEGFMIKFQESLQRAKKIKELKKNKIKAEDNELNIKIANIRKKIFNRDRVRLIKIKKYLRERECKRIAKHEKRLLTINKANLKKAIMKWENKMDYRLIRQFKNKAILLREKKHTQQRVAVRKMQIKKIIESTDFRSLSKKANLLRSHYESRSIENLSKVFYKQLKIFAIKKQKSDEMRLQQLLSNPDEITDEKDLAELKKLKEYARGMCKTIEIYKTPKISAAGLNEPLNGYLTITYQNVKDAIVCAMNTSHGFKTPISTMDIYTNAKIILDRIAKQDTFELPTDEFITNFVRKKLCSLIEYFNDEIQNRIKTILTETKEQREKKPPTNCCSCKMSKHASCKIKQNVSFGIAEIIEYSINCSKKKSEPSELDTSNKGYTMRPNTPIPKLKQVADAVLSTEDLTDEIDIWDEMNNDRTLTHVTKPQKLIIISNLARFSKYYKTQLDIYVMPCVDLVKYKIKKPAWLDEFDEFDECNEEDMVTKDPITEMSSIILLFPENDQNFTKTLNMLVILNAKSVIIDLSEYIKYMSTDTTTKHYRVIRKKKKKKNKKK